MTTDGSFAKKGKAEEEQYFRKMERDQLRQLADKIHQRELRQLLAILPEKHGLSEQDIHKILEWKHSTSSE